MADQGSEGLLSPYLRNQRLKAVQPYLRGRTLDFGCGGGTLARYCSPETYLGVDRDVEALAAAKRNFPSFQFQPELPPHERFDTIVALAVIEHLKQPSQWLRSMVELLGDGGAIVLTTPHPMFRRVHDVGAGLGVFSREASEEHESFLAKADLARLAQEVGLRLVRYNRFPFGANQVAVMSFHETR